MPKQFDRWEFRWVRWCYFTNANTRWNLTSRYRFWGGFKHVKGKNDATTFLPNTDKKGGTFKVAKRNNPNDFLTKEQAEFVYKRVNARKCINTSKIKQEMVQKN